MAMARTQGSRSGITGPKIRKAALHLFARHGYAAVSMRQIAAEVGVQVGALYNYTPDKQSLLVSLLETFMTDLLAGLDAVDWPTAPEAQLDAFVDFHIAFTLQRSDDVFISYMELRNLKPENFHRIETLRRSYENRLATILRDGEATGAFQAPDPKIATWAIIAMLNGVLTWYRAAGRLSLHDVQARYRDMVAMSVGATR